jgi:hypothetical protein
MSVLGGCACLSGRRVPQAIPSGPGADFQLATLLPGDSTTEGSSLRVGGSPRSGEPGAASGSATGGSGGAQVRGVAGDPVTGVGREPADWASPQRLGRRTSGGRIGRGRSAPRHRRDAGGAADSGPAGAPPDVSERQSGWRRAVFTQLVNPLTHTMTEEEPGCENPWRAPPA